jgi:hypothetical protein
VSRRPWTLDGRKAALSVVKNFFSPSSFVRVVGEVSGDLLLHGITALPVKGWSFATLRTPRRSVYRRAGAKLQPVVSSVME